jgi:ubiquinone/menaquinone biosynthesis C-methylase UbiE
VEAAKERLASGYSRAALQYDALAGHMYLAGIRRLLPRATVPLMPAILDVGCGTGVNLLEAARWFAPARLLCGIDLAPGMAAVARAKAAAAGVPAQITVGDAEQLPYADRTFDLVLCNSVLHWFKDRRQALCEMHRVLRPGGQLLLIGAVAPAFQEWFALVDGLMHASTGSKPLSQIPPLPTAAEVAGHLQAAGFVLEHFANPMHRQTIAEPEPFVRLMATVAPHWTADLSPEGQLALEGLAAQTMRLAWPGGFPNTLAAVEAVGRK